VSVQNIRCKHGSNVTLGQRIFASGECEIVDDGLVKIGDDVLLGPGVRIEAMGGKGVVIGDRVWIGNDVVIRSGANISEGAMICSGSVVESDVPAYTVVEGSPARVTWRLR
jgi:acetyltransferase-like isoleucine patch superfamily enzyme